MPRAQNQKLKILHLADYLLRCSDEEHPVSMKQIIDYLGKQDITAERKSIYEDMEALRGFGLDIVSTGSSRNTAYYIGSREFELPELKLMADSVQASKFITSKKTDALIQKLKSLTSQYYARQFDRQLLVPNRTKAMNETIYYSVDAIHAGIAQNRQIRFHYFEYNVAKDEVLRHGGSFYQISPFALIWDDENYYMVGYDADHSSIRHYRVDKMKDISITEEERQGQEAFAAQNVSDYSKKVFGMFSGETRSVQLRFTNHLVGAVIDRFGKEVMVIPDGPEHFTVRVDVVVSPQFFAWLFGFGEEAAILSPADVREKMVKSLKNALNFYET